MHTDQAEPAQAERLGELYGELDALLQLELTPARRQARMRELEGRHSREDVVWMLGVLAEDLQSATACARQAPTGDHRQ